MILDLFKKKEPEFDPAAREVLDQAARQRSKMELSFEDSVSSLRGIYCSVQKIGKGCIHLDVLGANPQGNYKGKIFRCFFKIQEGTKASEYYVLRASVQDTYRTQGGDITFVASLLGKIERSQRRKSLRIRPDLDWLAELMVWAGGKRANPQDGQFLLNIGELREGKSCRLENISAGGIGLFLDRRFCFQQDFYPNRYDELTFFMRFTHDVRNQPRELWLSGRIVRLNMDAVTKDLGLGVEFQFVALPVAEKAAALWQPVKENAAEELVSRFFEWHVFLCRERGIPV